MLDKYRRRGHGGFKPEPFSLLRQDHMHPCDQHPIDFGEGPGNFLGLGIIKPGALFQGRRDQAVLGKYILDRGEVLSGIALSLERIDRLRHIRLLDQQLDAPILVGLLGRGDTFGAQ